MRTTRPIRTLAAAGAVAAALAMTSAGPALADGHVVADGLVGPLGLSIGADGTFYVMESFSEQLTAIGKDGSRTTLATGPMSGGVDAQGKGQVVYTTRVGEEFGPPTAASLYRVTPAGSSREVASLLAYDETANPDAGNTYGFVDLDAECAAEVAGVFGPDFAAPYPGQVDSNPYAVAFHKGGYLVADAGGNSIVRVHSNGDVSTVAVLPPIPTVLGEEVLEFGAPECVIGAEYLSEPVPTDVEVGPDGNYYVTSLPGFPEAPGSGSVFRVTPSGDVSLVATGFSGAVDLAVAADGTIYVAELFGGQISMISDGQVSVLTQVDSPGALEIDRDGTLYATIDVFGAGALVRIAT